MHLCKLQHEQGLYFVFEHLASASTWNSRLVQQLMWMPDVCRVVGNMCMFDMMQEDSEGVARIRKATGFMTNPLCIAERLEVKCDGMHRHIRYGRAKAAEIYPDKLCREIVMGLVEQVERDEGVSKGIPGSIASFDKGEREQRLLGRPFG